MDLSGLAEVAPHVGETFQSHRSGFFSCTAYCSQSYTDSVKQLRDDLPEGDHIQAVYFEVVKPSPEFSLDNMSEVYPQGKEFIGSKSGARLFGLEGFVSGHEGMIQVHSHLDSKWKILFQVDSILEEPMQRDLLFSKIIESLDSVLATEQENGVLIGALTTPVARPAAYKTPKNEAEETVSMALNGALTDDLIAAADRLTTFPGSPRKDWYMPMVEKLNLAGEGACEIALVDSRESYTGTWSVVTDVSRCPLLYEDYFYSGGFQETAYVAWAVGPAPNEGENFWVWARGPAGPTVGDARFALETRTLGLQPEGWTSERN